MIKQYLNIKSVGMKHVLLAMLFFVLIMSYVFYSIGLNFLNFPYFVVALIFLFMIPGYQFIRLFKLKVSLLEKSTLSVVFGILLTTTLYYVLRFIRLRYSFLIVIGIVDLLFFLHLKRKQVANFFDIKIKLDKISILFLLLLIFNLFTISITSFPSGLLYDNGLRFYEQHAHDSMFRLALLGELSHEVPPTMEYFSGLPDKNYYFFQSLFINIINDVTKISLLDLHFRFVPFFLFGLLTIVTYIMVRHLFRSRQIALLSTLFLFFIEGISFLAPLFATVFLNPRYVFHQWNGIFSTSTNVMLHWSYPFLFSLPLFFTGVLVISYVYRYKKMNLLLPIIVFGLMIQYRAFLSLVIFPSLFIIGLVTYFSNKDRRPFIIMAASLVLSAVLLYKIYSPSGTRLKLFFAYPALLVLEFLDITTVNQLQGFLASHNVFFGIMVYAISILVFLVGFFGVRLAALSFVFKYLRNFKKTNPAILFLILCAIGTFLFPMFLVTDAASKTWLTGFFSHSATIFSIFLGPVAYGFLKNKIRFKKTIICVFLFLGLFGSLHFLLFHSFGTQGYYLISLNELDSLNFIRSNTQEDAVFIHRIFDIDFQNDPTLLNRTELSDNYLAINSIGHRRTVISTEFVPQSKFIPEEEIRERVDDVNTFFLSNDKDAAAAVLSKYDVDYAYVLKKDPLKGNALKLLTIFYDNRDVIIYKVKNNVKNGKIQEDH